MENFTFNIPTAIYFGKGQTEQLKNILPSYGKKVLLVYGGGSIKKNGIYQEVTGVLESAGISFEELGGVEPNPRIETVRKGADICKEKNIEVLLPVGGGSTIDCAKAIAAAACYDGDAWELVEDGTKIKRALPVVTVLTLAATGSEMDAAAVISDMTASRKIGTISPWLRPKASIMDPSHTESVNAWHTACGAADIMSHAIENYFAGKKAFFQERVTEALLKTCIEYGIRAVKNPKDYEARANLMWSGSWAINGFLKLGKNVTFTVHPIEHEVSAYYDLTHGAGLAILMPHWMRYVLDDSSVEDFRNYAVNVWGVKDTLPAYEAAAQGIDKTAEYFKSMGLPSRLSEAGIDDTKFSVMAENASKRLKGVYRQLDADDIEKIYRSAF